MFLAGIIQPADTLPGGLHIPASVVQADNNHRFDIILTNVSGRKMEMPRRQRIVTMSNSVMFAPIASTLRSVQLVIKRGGGSL